MASSERTFLPTELPIAARGLVIGDLDQAGDGVPELIVASANLGRTLVDTATPDPRR